MLRKNFNPKAINYKNVTNWWYKNRDSLFEKTRKII